MPSEYIPVPAAGGWFQTWTVYHFFEAKHGISICGGMPVRPHTNTSMPPGEDDVLCRECVARCGPRYVSPVRGA